MNRVFLDANVLFSAAYLPDSGLTKLWSLGVDLITSAYAIEEARRNLATGDERRRLERLLEPLTIVQETDRARRLPKGVDLPDKDVPILLAALSANATHLVTGDTTHFGVLYGVTIAGTTILAPAAYLKLFPDAS